MAPFVLLILICSVSLDHAACQRSTALDVLQGPPMTSEMDCATRSQMWLGSLAIAPRKGLEYAKIVCERAPRNR